MHVLGGTYPPDIAVNKISVAFASRKISGGYAACVKLSGLAANGGGLGSVTKPAATTLV